MNQLPEVHGFGSGVGGSPDGIGASPDGIGLPPLGLTVQTVNESTPASTARKVIVQLYGLASIAGAGLGAYHGYKRNNSVGWAIGWAVLGGLFPIITIPVSMAQGFGERK